MPKSNKARKGRASANAASTKGRGESGGQERRRRGALGQRPDPPKKGLHGVPGSKNDSRRCTATANRTGERCKAPAIKGGTVCRMHGGALPQVKQSAKDRLLALVDPALAALDQILRSKDADDAHKVRAALGILDRTGFRPGVDIAVHGPTPWELLADSAIEPDIDRSALGPADEPAALGAGDPDDSLSVFQKNAQTEGWAEYDAEDEQPYATRLDRFGPNVVHGEVVEPD